MGKCCVDSHGTILNKLKNSSFFFNGVAAASNLFSLLGEENRMKIVLALAEGELCVYHICEITGGKQSATSQHLKKLKNGGIIKCRKDGNLVLYSLQDEHIVTIVRTALEHTECY